MTSKRVAVLSRGKDLKNTDIKVTVIFKYKKISFYHIFIMKQIVEY